MASGSDSKTPVYVTVSALDAGHLTLPERLFVTDADPDKYDTVPSLAFLIQHPSSSLSRPGSNTNLVFDLGVKRDLDAYTPSQALHTAARQPVITDPDAAESLRSGVIESYEGVSRKSEPAKEPLLDPGKDIDFVVISHVHWDHVGTPSDFTGATFAVGSGTLDLLKNGAGPSYPADLFNDDELPASRTVEFPPVKRTGSGTYIDGPNVPKHTATPADTSAKLPASANQWNWTAHGTFPHALDFFGDGSLYVIDTPGHLYGHVNVLARVGERKYVYLGGDCCHDARILRGEKGIAEYDDGRGGVRSVHVDTGVAASSLTRIGEFVKKQKEARDVDVEVVLAHDAEWRENNRHRFWPGKL